MGDAAAETPAGRANASIDPTAARETTAGKTSNPEHEISAEQRRSNAGASRRLAAAFGQIVAVFMRSQRHRKLALADLEWLIAPAVVTGQFSLAEARSKKSGLVAPIGVVLWANVSKDVDERLARTLEEPIKLAPAEWRSGDIVWVVDALGEPRVLEAMLKQLAAKQWAGKRVKLRARDRDGKAAVGVLGGVNS